jgi:metal-responsive CopG/Arc/MetJ family transcriptional regulator
MTSIKTAISIEKDLFDQAESLAHEMNVSRSRLFVLALEEYISRVQNQRMLREINAAYDENQEAPETAYSRKMRRTHRQIVEGEW